MKKMKKVFAVLLTLTLLLTSFVTSASALVAVEEANATITIAADDKYTLYVDGVQIGERPVSETTPDTHQWETAMPYRVTLKNDFVIAVKGQDLFGSIAGLSITVQIDGKEAFTIADSKWKQTIEPNTDDSNQWNEKDYTMGSGWSSVKLLGDDTHSSWTMDAGPWGWSDNYLVANMDKTVYFRYENPTYTVTYDGNGNTGGEVPVDAAEYSAGDEATVLGNVGVPELTKTNYSFIGWKTSDVSSPLYNAGDKITMPAQDVTLYAQWEKDPQYTVIYNGNGSDNDGDAPVDNQSPYYAGDSVTVTGPGLLVKTNYTFTGWKATKEVSFDQSVQISSLIFGNTYSQNDVFAMPEENVVFYAQWEENEKYTVTYDGNNNTGGSAPVDVNSPYYADASVTVTGPGLLVKTNHTFTGWNTMASGAGLSYDPTDVFLMPDDDVTLYAQWEENDKFTVTYYGNGSDNDGDAPVDNQNPYYAGDTVTVTGPGLLVKTNYTFAGWKATREILLPRGTQADSLVFGSIYNQDDEFLMPDENVVFYAQWVEEGKYSVTYNGNGNTGGTAPVDGDSPYYAGETVTVLGKGDLVKTNYTFDGWYYYRLPYPDKQLTAQITPIAVDIDENDTFNMPADNVILYAKWVMDDTYTVTYAPGDHGTFSPQVTSDLFAGDNTPSAPLLTPGETGWSFVGWSPVPSAKVSETITYTAQWSEIPTYTVTYAPGDHGTFTAQVTTGLYAGDSTPAAPTSTPGETGWSFASWEPEVAEFVSGSAVYVAQWNQDIIPTYSVSISKIADNEAVFVGATINYTITITNTGNTTLYSVYVTDSMFGGLVGSRDELLSGESFTISGLSFTTISPGIISNTATVTAMTQQERNIEMSSTALVLVNSIPVVTETPGILVSISPDQTLVLKDTEVTYTITVSNTGNTILNNVALSSAELGFSQTLSSPLYVLGSQSFTVTKTMDEVLTFTPQVTASGISPQFVTVNDNDSTEVVVYEEEEEEEVIIPETPGANPQTGEVPYSTFLMMSLLVLGAGMVLFRKRSKITE